MTYTNNAYGPIRNYVDAHSGFGADIIHSSEYQQYMTEMEQIKGFNGKRVRIKYVAQTDWSGRRGEATGRIIVQDEKIMFLKGRSRSKYQTLDVGLYEGFHAVITPLSIEAIN